MWHIQIVPDAEAEGSLRKLYDEDLSGDGYIWNTSRVWSQRPEIGDSWKKFIKSIRSNMRLRTYELATLGASKGIGCVYCMLAHGSILHKNGFTPQQIIAILEDHHSAELAPVEVHMIDLAIKTSQDSNSVTPEDIDLLRQDGLNDQQITDIVLAVVARNFISRFFNTLGADPDPELIQKEPELWAYLKDWKTVHAEMH